MKGISDPFCFDSRSSIIRIKSDEELSRFTQTSATAWHTCTKKADNPKSWATFSFLGSEFLRIQNLPNWMMMIPVRKAKRGCRVKTWLWWGEIGLGSSCFNVILLAFTNISDVIMCMIDIRGRVEWGTEGSFIGTLAQLTAQFWGTESLEGNREVRIEVVSFANRWEEKGLILGRERRVFKINGSNLIREIQFWCVLRKEQEQLQTKVINRSTLKI